MASVDRDWLLEGTNIRRLAQAADDAAEDEYVPEDLKREFRQLENLLYQIERTMRRHDM